MTQLEAIRGGCGDGAQPCPLVSAPGLNQVEGTAMSPTPEQLLEGLGTKTAAATPAAAPVPVCTLGEPGLLPKPRNGPQEQEPEEHRSRCKGRLAAAAAAGAQARLPCIPPLPRL